MVRAANSSRSRIPRHPQGALAALEDLKAERRDGLNWQGRDWPLPPLVAR
jgi:hypothetical protein